LKPLIDIENLQISEDGSRILSSAYLKVNENEKVAVFGPGGSGKSLLLKFINGEKKEGLKYTFNTYYNKDESVFYLNLNESQKLKASRPKDLFDLYLIDEPENGYELSDFSTFVSQIQSSLGTLIYVTHNLDFLQFADKILVMKYGEQKGIYNKKEFFNSADHYVNYISKMGC